LAIARLGDKWGWTPVLEELDSEDEEGHGIGGKAQVGGLKPPAVKVKKAELAKQVKKLEAKIVKLKELKKIEKCKRW